MEKAKNKYIVSGQSRFSKRQREYLAEKGFGFFYEMRDQEGIKYSIEDEVVVNNIGCIATNFEIQEKDPVFGKTFLMDIDLWKIYRAEVADDDIDWREMNERR